MQRFRQSLQRFARDESGVMLAEFLILFPLLIWGFIGLTVYWDVFRTINVSQKAAYSISDLLSRQEVVNEQFVNGLQNVLDFLTPGAPESRMRITSLEFRQNDPGPADDSYFLLWSRSPGDRVERHTTDSIQDLDDQIPTIDNLASVIIVETWVDYVPAFDIGVLNFAPGITNQTFTQFVVTFPRRRRVCLEGTVTCA
mgnify:CR=1 FL=1